MNRFDKTRGSFFHYRHDPLQPNSLSHDHVWTILEDGKGGMWIGTHGDGLNFFDPLSKTFITFSENIDEECPFGLKSNRIQTLFQSVDGTIWVGTIGGGLSRYDPTKPASFVTYQPDPSNSFALGNEHVMAIHQDREGMLWIGTWNGLYRFDTDTNQFSLYRPKELEGLFRIWSLIEDRQGFLWIGTHEEGVFKFHKTSGRFENYRPNRTIPNCLSHRNVSTIVEDRSGVLWFGTLGGGLNKLYARFSHYRLDALTQEEDPPWALALVMDTQDRLWMGTTQGLMVFDEKRGLRNIYRHEPENERSISHDRVTTLHLDGHGILWAGTYRGGLNRLDTTAPEGKSVGFIRYQYDPENPKSISGDNVSWIHKDREGTLWVGTARMGLNRWDGQGNQFTRFLANENHAEGLPNNTITSILEDRRGRLWLGTYGGLALMDREKKGIFSVFRHADGNADSLSHNRVLCLKEDDQGRFWVGTDGGGLNRIDFMDRDTRHPFFKHFHKKSGLPGDSIFGILEDESGFFWISTDKGLARFDSKRETFNVFDVRDGLSDDEFIFGAYCRSPTGELLFAGPQGLNIFSPRRIQDNRIPPPVVITDFLLFNRSVVPKASGSPLQRPIQQTSELLLSHKDIVFSFEFAALDFANPQKNRYRYRLQGLEEQWTETTADKRFATYTHLDGGRYMFQVQGSNRDGIWNEQAVNLPIRILPPPWKSWWAYSLYTLILLGILLGYMSSQNKKLAHERSMRRYLDQQVSERTCDLKQKNEEILENHDQLQTQAQQLQKQAARLTEMDRLKTRFFTNISHEFRTPLTLIQGPIADLLADQKLESAPRAKLAMVQRNARRLMGLIDDLLDISKIEAGSMDLRAREEDLVAFVRKHKLAFAAWAERKGLDLVLRSERESMPVFIDVEKMEKVLMNLISNAIKYTERGGRILVTLSYEKESDGVIIQVRDTGEGIAKDQLPFIFDRFFQAKQDAGHRGGAGIGLALAREIIHLHGGEISAESEAGFGSSFTVRLPRVQDRFEPEKRTPTASEGSIDSRAVEQPERSFESDALPPPVRETPTGMELPPF